MHFFLKIVTVTAVIFLSLIGRTDACVSGTCSSSMCSDIPADNTYYLTSFCDSSVACGSFSGNCNEYYAADYKRFGCNSVISCCKGSNCVNLKVIDGGPNCSVEDSAKKQVVDASYSTCKHFTGSNSCGWSDKVTVTCKKTSYTVDDTSDGLESGAINFAVLSGRRPLIPLGPCSYNASFAQINDVPMCGYDEGLF